MVIVELREGQEVYDVNKPLWQWDYGQRLRMYGIPLPAAVETQFSLDKNGGESTTRIGITKNGVTEVAIPDQMVENEQELADAYYFYCFVYLRDEGSGKTVLRIDIPVTTRSKPEVFDSPEEEELFKEAILAVNESADRAETAEKSAEAWAHGHEEYPERAEDNAKYYAGQAKETAGAIREEVQGMVNEANSAKNTAIENANISASKANETEADRVEVEQNKAAVTQLKNETEQIKQDTLLAEQRVIQLMSTDTKSYFFATIVERDAATGIHHCDRCSVLETRADYIYDTEDIDGNEKNPEWIKTSDWDALKSVAWDIITGKPNFATVATTGKYDDLLEIPNRYNNPIVLDGTTDTIEWDYSQSDTAIVTLTADKALNISNSYNGCRASLDVYGAKLILDDETYLKSATYAYLEAVEGEHYHYEFQKIIDKWQVGMMVIAGAEAGETV